MHKLFAGMASALVWLGVPANRLRVYRLARVAIPFLVAAGFLTDGRASLVLAILAAVGGFAAPHLAARNVPKRPRGEAGSVELGLLVVIAIGVGLLLFRVHLGG